MSEKSSDVNKVLKDDGVSSIDTINYQNLNNIDIEIYEYDYMASDNLFDIFYNNVSDFTVEDYKLLLKLNKTAAENLKNAIDGKSVKSMLGIQDVPQIGTKAIESIHNFIRNKKNINIQKKLDF